MKKFFIILLVLIAELVYAQVPYGTKFHISFIDDCWPGPVFIQPLAESGYAVLWQRQRPRSTRYDLMARVFRDDDSTATSTITVASGNQKSYSLPNLLTLAGGGFAAAWSESASPQAGSYINVHFYSRDGQETGTPVRLYHPYSLSALWMLGVHGQTIEISWYVYEMGLNAIVGQLAGPDASQFSEEYTIYDFRQIGYVDPQHTKLDNGNRVICWYVNENLQGEYGDRAAVLLSAQGMELKRWALPIVQYGSRPNAISLAQGGFVILGSSAYNETFVKFYSFDGTEINSLEPPLKSPYAKEQVGQIFVMRMGDMGCFICGVRAGILGQYYALDGKKIHDQFTFPKSMVGTLAQAGPGHKGELLIAWYEAANCGSTIMAARMPSPLRSIPMAEFQCLAPANDTFVKTDKVTLSWQSATLMPALYPWEVLTYSIAVSQAPDSGFVRIAEDKTDTSFTLANLKGGRNYFWKVLAKNIYGDSVWSSNVNAFFVSYSVGVAENQYNRPQGIRLLQNYPNPFNSSTKIFFCLDAPAKITITVWDVLGRRVKTLYDGSQIAGEHSVVWDGTDKNNMPVPSGIYLVRMSGSGFSQTRKVVLEQ
jgi:hypothetical protein